MDWKSVISFLKPDWRKGIVFTAILLFGSLGMFQDIPFAGEVFFLTNLMGYMSIGPLAGVVLYLVVLVIYWQIVSSVLVWCYEKIREKM